MLTLLTGLLIAIPALALFMVVLRYVLYLLVVGPAIRGRSVRSWINAITWDNQSADIRRYVSSLAEEERRLWKNRFLAYSGYLIGTCVAIWVLILAGLKRADAF